MMSYIFVVFICYNGNCTFYNDPLPMTERKCEAKVESIVAEGVKLAAACLPVKPQFVTRNNHERFSNAG